MCFITFLTQTFAISIAVTFYSYPVKKREIDIVKTRNLDNNSMFFIEANFK